MELPKLRLKIKTNVRVGRRTTDVVDNKMMIVRRINKETCQRGLEEL